MVTVAQTRSTGSRTTGSDLPRRPPLREAQREFTRRLLTEVALEVFERDGYANATVDEIVKAANATRATFYQYFSSKREVIGALLATMNEDGAALFVRAFELEAPPTRATVRRWLEDGAAWYARNRGAIKAVRDAAAEHPELTDEIAHLRRQFIGALARQLAPARYGAELRATLLEAQREQLMQWWLVEDWPVDREAALEALTDVWAEALGATR